LWRRWRCSGCGLASAWTSANLVPFARYPSLDAAWWHEREQWLATARWLVRTPALRCWRCGAPVVRRDRPPATGEASQPLRYVLHWSCFTCDIGTFYAHLFAVVAGLLPDWMAFWRSAPRLLLGPERLVKVAGEEQVILTAWDRDTGRRATLAVARQSLEVRRLEVD
jgi:hypothetical protein